MHIWKETSSTVQKPHAVTIAKMYTHLHLHGAGANMVPFTLSGKNHDGQVRLG